MKIWSWIQDGFETVSRPEYYNSAWVLRTEYSFFNPMELQIDYEMTTLIAVSITTAMSHIKSPPKKKKVLKTSTTKLLKHLLQYNAWLSM